MMNQQPMNQQPMLCSACGKPIVVDECGVAECGCDYADPKDLEAGHSFLPQELPESWKPNRVAICNQMDVRYLKFVEAVEVTYSLGEMYVPV